MSADDPNGENFDETFRSIAEELGRFLERSVENIDLDERLEALGVDPAAVRSWAENAGSWLRGQAENLGDEVARRASEKRRTAAVEALGGAAPHPLDLPTEEQGRALAALDSGRWMVEPGTDALAAKGDGPEPRGALGVVRELRVRDWIGRDGQPTRAGRRALARWLDAAAMG